MLKCKIYPEKAKVTVTAFRLRLRALRSLRSLLTRAWLFECTVATSVALAALLSSTPAVTLSPEKSFTFSPFSLTFF